VILSGPGRSVGDEPGVEAIGGCVHKWRALNTRLSSGTSTGIFAVSAGPYINYQTEARPIFRYSAANPDLFTRVSVIDQTGKIFFERLYLLLGLRRFWPRVNCLCAPTPPQLTYKLIS